MKTKELERQVEILKERVNEQQQTIANLMEIVMSLQSKVNKSGKKN